MDSGTLDLVADMAFRPVLGKSGLFPGGAFLTAADAQRCFLCIPKVFRGTAGKHHLVTYSIYSPNPRSTASFVVVFHECF